MCHNSKMLYHDCTISGRVYSNITNKLDKVNCKACLNAMMNNKLIREIYSEEYIDTGMNRMKWIEFKPEKGSKINQQAIALLSDQSVTCVVLFGVKENNDGSKSPAFLVSQNFRDPQFFIEDFMKLLGEHAKFNQIIRK